MNEFVNAIHATADRALQKAGACDDFSTAWPIIVSAGLHDLLLPEAEGGAQAGWSVLCRIARLAGWHASPVPTGEAAIARHALHRMGEISGGFATIAVGAEGTLDATHFSGSLNAIPWGRYATIVVAQSHGAVFAVATREGTLAQGNNLAGEPRDTWMFREAPLIGRSHAPQTSLLQQGALLRAAQAAGALDRALAMSIDYANQRVQFGKPIGKFQAVQQTLAMFAEEAAAANCAVQSAASALDAGEAGLEIMAAKLRACLATDMGAAAAHQIHGAIGFTQEYRLQLYTQRLNAWRSEFGNDRFWAEKIGMLVCAGGADALWPNITARGG